MDFLLFRKMLMPLLTQFLFWLGLITCIAGAFYSFLHHAYHHGLEVLILGPIILRLFCEFLIVIFRINETLTELKNAVQRRV